MGNSPGLEPDMSNHNNILVALGKSYWSSNPLSESKLKYINHFQFITPFTSKKTGKKIEVRKYYLFTDKKIVFKKLFPTEHVKVGKILWWTYRRLLRAVMVFQMSTSLETSFNASL